MSEQIAATHAGQIARTPLVAVVVVNWNGWKDTLAAHESLLADTTIDWKLIVIDNASTDGSLQHLAALPPEVTVVASQINLGFAGGCNLGVETARAMGARYIFFLNNDAMVVPDTLRQLVEASEAHGDTAALGAVVRYHPAGTLQFFGSRRSAYWGTPERLQAPHDVARLSDPYIDTADILGAAMFVPTALLAKVGGFDERFFLNFEETDWCYRARAEGVDCIVVAKALVLHRSGASLGSFEAPMQAYFMNRNELLFSEKHGSARQFLRSYKKMLVQIARRTASALRQRARGGEGRLSPSTKALALAVRDYTFRRFGDCPDVVRVWAREHRDATR